MKLNASLKIPVGSKQVLYRILDANFNRSKEGLRVCEDVCRYVWNEKLLTRSFKDIRHELSSIYIAFDGHKMLEARHIQGDVGKETIKHERQRKDLKAVFEANCQRVKESLRVLEEVYKLIDTGISERIKVLRYKIYAVEQKANR